MTGGNRNFLTGICLSQKKCDIMSSRGSKTKNGHVTMNEYHLKESKRVYDAKVFPVIEIGYHPEPNLTGNRHEYVLHYHTFDSTLKRTLGGRISVSENADIYEKYKIYLEEYGL